MPPVKLTFEGEDDGALKLIGDLEKQVDELRKEVNKLSGTKIKVETDPAEEELKQLRAELRKVDAAYKRALTQRNFAVVIAETDKTTQATKRLATANQNLAARGKVLVRFAKNLPPELRKVATGLDRVEKEAEQAQRAFVKLGASKRSVTGLVSTLGQLRTGVGALIAALGVQQLIRFGRTLIRIGAQAVETKKKFDSLIPGLRAFTGSTELAENVADRLAATADRLKTPLASLIQPFLRISAATKETNLTLAEQADLFESALLTVRAFGLGTEETSRLITGFAQVAGKGTLQMEELKQQIGEVAFNALPALSKALGISLPDLFQQVSAGAIDAETALRGLASGLREANEAAGLAQLDTLKGDLGAFARASEEAERALADGLEPGLRSLTVAATEFLDRNEKLIAGLGELGSAGLQGLGFVAKGAEAVSLGVQAAAEGTETFGQRLVDLNQLGLNTIGDAIRGIGRSLQDADADAEKFIDDATEGFRKILNEGAGTAEEILVSFRESFREQAKAAGASAEDIKAIETDLAARVGAIQEESLEFRRGLQQDLADDIKEFGEVRVETEERVGNLLARILEASVRERAALLETLVEETKRVAEARIKAEQDAEKGILESFEAIKVGAAELAGARIDEAAKASTKIQELELELAQKTAEIQAEFLEQARAAGDDRVKLEAETTEKLAKLNQDIATKIAAEHERIAEASRKAAESRIKDEQRVRAELEKTAQKLLEQLEAIKEAAGAADEGEGSAFKPFREDVESAVGSLEELNAKLEELRQGADPGSVLEAGFQGLLDILGPTTDSFDDFFNTGQQGTQAVTDGFQESSGAADALAAAIEAAKQAVGGLGPEASASVGTIIDEFESLKAQSNLTERVIDDLAKRLAEALKEPVKPAEDLGQAVDDVGKGDKGLEKVGAAAGTMAEQLKAASDAAKDAGESVIKLADGSELVVPAFGEVNEAAINAKGGLEEFKEAGESAVEPLEKIVKVAEKLREPIVGEQEPDKLRDLGEAATEAQEPIAALAEPVERIAAGAVSLNESLPALVEQVTALTPALQELVGLLAENPVDLEAIKAQLAAIAEPLTTIGVDLASVSDSITALPEPLEKLREPAEVLFGLVATAAEGGTFGKVAEPLERIAKAAPEIPEPLEKFGAALKVLVEMKDDVAAALEATKAGLEAVASKEILEPLALLEEKLEEIVEELDKAGKRTAAWKEATAGAIQTLGNASDAAQTLADTLDGSLGPALENAAEKAGEAAKETETLRDNIISMTENITAFGSAAEEAFAAYVAGAEAAIAATQDLIAAEGQLAEATAAISPP